MINYIFYIISLAIISGLCVFVYDLKKRIVSQNKDIVKLQSQKRSLETIYGNAVENLTPFTEEFKNLDPKNFRQLGKPIDFIYFGEDEILIIEVKSGNSKLSQHQRNIKSLVDNKKVFFKEVRIKR